MNLVVNGAESMHFGGELHVRVRQAPLPTDVRYLAPQVPPPGTPMVEIRVVDQGAGFSPAAFTHLF
jgi:signal transduction histidine kinase